MLRETICDKVGVNRLFGGWIRLIGHDAVDWEWRNVVEVARLESILLSTASCRTTDRLVCWVIGALSTGQILRRKHVQMVTDWKHFRLRVKMIFACHFMGTSDETHARVLNCLKTAN